MGYLCTMQIVELRDVQEAFSTSPREREGGGSERFKIVLVVIRAWS